MNRSYSLKKNKQFQYVYRRGSSFACRHWVLRYVKTRNSALLIGLSVGKKVGGSVTRNHIKRLARENLRPMLPNMKPGLYIFLAREGASQATYYTIKRDFDYLLGKAGLLDHDSQC